MGAFADFFASHGLDPQKVLRTSTRLESQSLEGRTLSQRRADKRRTDKAKSYADAGIAKPPAGRGFSISHLKNAQADRPVPARVRSKVMRAVNAELKKAGKEPVGIKAIFGDVPAAAPKAKTAAKKK